MKYPRSPYDKEGGLVYFPRMLDKIRLKLTEQLADEYKQKLGSGFDSRCCEFLGVAYKDVEDQVKWGNSDTEVLKWCRSHSAGGGSDVEAWNDFMVQRGARDADPKVGEMLAGFKRDSGLADRDDILTFFDFFEVDEKRKP